MSLYRPSSLLSFLQQERCHPKKRLSQHFLIDGNIVKKILETVQPDDDVIEIGPGPGVLTEALLQKGARLVAIEKDPTLARLLQRLKKEDGA